MYCREVAPFETPSFGKKIGQLIAHATNAPAESHQPLAMGTTASGIIKLDASTVPRRVSKPRMVSFARRSEAQTFRTAASVRGETLRNINSADITR